MYSVIYEMYAEPHSQTTNHCCILLNLKRKVKANL